MRRRRTKIICTIGPATANFPMLEQLQAAGMNIVRLNMSHADHASAKKIINWIRTLNRKVKYPVAILLDTQGPEIRTGEINEPMDLSTGDVVTISVLPEDVERDMDSGFDAAAMAAGFSVTGHNVDIHGLCAECVA